MQVSGVEYCGSAHVELLDQEVFDRVHGELLNDAGQVNYDSALPLLIQRYYPAGLVGLGVTALLAGFMAGQAGNVSAFNTVWTYDIYRALIRKDATDAHLLWMGRVTTVVGIILSVGTAYWAKSFPSIMDYMQAIFSWVNAPLFATMLLGMFIWWITPSVAAGGVLLYETFAGGNQTVGKPSNPAFLLEPGELLRAAQSLRVVAYEDGFLTGPERYVQRLAAVRESPSSAVAPRYPL